MSLFYVTHLGSQLGPYDKNQISDLLKAKKLNWNDYLFDEKSSNWIHVMEHADFTDVFNTSFSDPLFQPQAKINVNIDELKKRQWFVLKENTNYGPFSKAELIQMLQGKTLFEFDFIWKQGIDSWKKLSDVEDFSEQNIKAVHAQARTPFEKNLNQIFFRRKYVRAQLVTKIIIHDHKKIYNTASNEISEGGASFGLKDVKFEIGQQLYLHFSPGEGVPQFNVIAKVVSHRNNMFGVQFVNLSGVAKSFISKYTEDFKKVA
jgi:hypothetical protein